MTTKTDRLAANIELLREYVSEGQNVYVMAIDDRRVKVFTVSPNHPGRILNITKNAADACGFRYNPSSVTFSTDLCNRDIVEHISMTLFNKPNALESWSMA